MKLAWLVWAYEDTEVPEFRTDDPGRREWYFKVVQIVYTEIQE